MKSFKELEAEFKEKQSLEKEKIKAIPSKGKRILKWIIYLCVFPFKWLWVNIRDFMILNIVTYINYNNILEISLILHGFPFQ